MQTFKKEERLNSKAIINKLFEQGTYITVSPFRSVWMEYDFSSEIPIQIAISVSKKKFKHAVDRNRIKRLIREAYRQNKHILSDYLSTHKKKCVIMFIYTGKSALLFKELESKIILTLQRLMKEFEEKNNLGINSD